MHLLRASEIKLLWSGDKLCALAGPDLEDGLAGFGTNATEALADLVKKLRAKNTTLWVPHPARSFREDGVLKCACPQCGHVSDMTGLEDVIAYVCEECGSGIEVAPLPESGENGPRP